MRLLMRQMFVVTLVAGLTTHRAEAKRATRVPQGTSEGRAAEPGPSEAPRLGLCFPSSFVGFLEAEETRLKELVDQVTTCGTLLSRRGMSSEAWLNWTTLTRDRGLSVALSDLIQDLKVETSAPEVAKSFGFRQEWSGRTPAFLCVPASFLDRVETALASHDQRQRECEEAFTKWQAAHPKALDAAANGHACSLTEAGASFAHIAFLTRLQVAAWSAEQVSDKKLKRLFTKLYDGIFIRPPVDQQLGPITVPNPIDPMCLHDLPLQGRDPQRAATPAAVQPDGASRRGSTP